MFANMKEEMAKQRALFDCEWGQPEQDRESMARMAREREETKCLNNLLLAQIEALRNTRVQLPSPERPIVVEALSRSGLIVGGVEEQPFPLHWNNPTTDRVLFIPA